MSAWAGPGAYLEFLVSELDSNSYLFCSPVFYANEANGLRIAGLRIVVNGVTPVNGQAFTNVDAASFGQPAQVSRLCSVIQKDQGAALDIFEIDLEVVDSFEHQFVDLVAPPTINNSVLPAVPAEGLRDFQLLNASMSSLTGVSPATPAVLAEFSALQQQLPAGFDMRTFVSSNQMGISKLALEYCDELVENTTLRDAFFGALKPVRLQRRRAHRLRWRQRRPRDHADRGHLPRQRDSQPARERARDDRGAVAGRGSQRELCHLRRATHSGHGEGRLYLRARERSHHPSLTRGPAAR